MFTISSYDLFTPQLSPQWSSELSVLPFHYSKVATRAALQQQALFLLVRAEETKKGLQEKAEEMIYPSFAPLGYRNVVGPNGKKIIEPDPDRAPIIILIFEWYDTDNYSIEQITQKAADEGLVSRNGKLVSKSNIHNILRKRIYTGDFDWNGKTYRGSHQPLISSELYERVQAKLDGRFEGREKKANREFAFSGLVKCGHCGCALVGELKKGRYIYYHCTGRRGKCDEPYTREEVLEEQFAGYLKKLVFDDDVLEWVTQALRQSRENEKQFHDEAVARLQSQYETFQRRLDKLYEDKIDDVISADFFKRKSKEWEAEQVRILRAIDEHRAANHAYINEGVKLLELAKKAYLLYEKQKADEKRKLLDFVCSNSTWREGHLTVNFRQPFDMIAVTNQTWINEKAAGADSGDLRSIWLRR